MKLILVKLISSWKFTTTKNRTSRYSISTNLDALVVDKEPVVPVNQEVVPPTNINNVPGGIPQQPSGLNVEPEKPLGNGINQQPLNQNNIEYRKTRY